MDDRAVRQQLHVRHETEHFVFRFGYRSPFTASGPTRSGPELAPGPHGVHSVEDVHKQAEFFERAWETYQRPPWRFRAPLGYSQMGKCLVFLFNLRGGISGRTSSAGKAGEREAVIDVRSHWGGPMASFDLRRAQAAAAHELFHAIQMAYRPPPPRPDPHAIQMVYRRRPPRPDPWRWWSEATATHMQDEVFGKNDQNMTYMRTWLGECGRSLDTVDEWREYGSAIFCKFLARTYGADIVRRVWERSRTARSPLGVLDTLVQNRLGLPLASAQERDLFASGFCVANFFPDDPEAGYLHGHDYASAFKHASVSGLVRPGERRGQEGSLDHLAAAYYLVPGRRRRPSRMSVYLRVKNPGRAEPPVKAVLIPMAPGDRARAVEILPRRTKEGDFVVSRPVPVRDVDWRQGGVLLVANCSWGDEQVDEVRYAVEMSIA